MVFIVSRWTSVRYYVLRLPRFSTFVIGDPADNFSKNNGIANGPKRQVPARHDLKQTLPPNDKLLQGDIPQRALQVFPTDSIGIVRRRSERNRKVTKRDIKKVL